MDVVIRAGRLIDGTGGPARSNVRIHLRDGRIQAVEADREPRPDEDTIEARELTAIPGLIDTHVHLAFSASADPLGDLRRDDDRRMLARAAGSAVTALAAGITTVRDAGDRHGVVIALRDAIRDGLVPGPRVIAAGMPITTTGGHCWWLGLEADSTNEVISGARRLHRMGADLFKVMATGGGMTAGSASEEPQYPLETLSALVEEGRRLGKPVAAHARGTPGIRQAAQAGVSTIEHCSWLSRDGIDFDERVAEEIARKGIFVNATLGLAFIPMTPGWYATPTAKRTAAQLEDRLRALRRQVALGTKMTAGTDAGIMLAPFDMLAQNVGTMVEQLGLSPMEGIRSATGLAAESVGLGGEIGTVEPGKRADLVFVEGDPLADIHALRRVRRVLRDGRTVALDGRIVHASAFSALYQADGSPQRPPGHA